VVNKWFQNGEDYGAPFVKGRKESG